MRRSERHHLKENAFAVFIGGLRQQLQDVGPTLGVGVAIGVVGLVLYGGYSWWSERAASQAGLLLATALVVADAPVVPPAPPTPPAGEDAGAEAAPEAPFVQPAGTYPSVAAKMTEAVPKLLEAAEAYPNTSAGVTARYRAATGLAALGRHNESADQYLQVIERDGAGVYTRMATLGLADVELARGGYDAAITLLEESTSAEAAELLPIDGVLMRLGQAYELAGRTDEARATFQRVLEEFPQSVYAANAERELESLQAQG
ncbi:MAG: tetratricopeptide repeat protein [Acidobacteria bacterium]|nr:tetratricopeptide repeat protein [Acidobacteriota bacterium]